MMTPTYQPVINNGAHVVRRPSYGDRQPVTLAYRPVAADVSQFKKRDMPAVSKAADPEASGVSVRLLVVYAAAAVAGVYAGLWSLEAEKEVSSAQAESFLVIKSVPSSISEEISEETCSSASSTIQEEIQEEISTAPVETDSDHEYSEDSSFCSESYSSSTSSSETVSVDAARDPGSAPGDLSSSETVSVDAASDPGSAPEVLFRLRLDDCLRLDDDAVNTAKRELGPMGFTDEHRIKVLISEFNPAKDHSDGTLDQKVMNYLVSKLLAEAEAINWVLKSGRGKIGQIKALMMKYESKKASMRGRHYDKVLNYLQNKLRLNKDKFHV